MYDAGEVDALAGVEDPEADGDDQEPEDEQLKRTTALDCVELRDAVRAPSAASSSTETTYSTEGLHCCEEWELFPESAEPTTTGSEVVIASAASSESSVPLHDDQCEEDGSGGGRDGCGEYSDDDSDNDGDGDGGDGSDSEDGGNNSEHVPENDAGEGNDEDGGKGDDNGNDDNEDGDESEVGGHHVIQEEGFEGSGSVEDYDDEGEDDGDEHEPSSPVASKVGDEHDDDGEANDEEGVAVQKDDGCQQKRSDLTVDDEASLRLKSVSAPNINDMFASPAPPLGDSHSGRLDVGDGYPPVPVKDAIALVQISSCSTLTNEDVALSEEEATQRCEERSPTQTAAEDSLRRRIQVLVRVRPPFDCEEAVVVTSGEARGTSLCVQASSAQGSISTVTECAFDRVFLGDATQEDVFAAVEPSVLAALEGYNATVFAYGQTGTGKTHTLFGSELDVSMVESSANTSWGIVPRALKYLLTQAAAMRDEQIQVELQCSFLQIYNDRLFDLLTDRKRHKPLLVREQPALDGTMSVSVQGLSSESVTSLSNALQLIHRGYTNRCVRETEANLSSSRSHVIVQLHITTERAAATTGVDKLVRKARLNLVDLAGSEKWNTELEMADARSQELKNINTSLSALGNCIAALAEPGRRHIPYRDSTLTRVLQDSFGGNTQSCLLATVSATRRASDETLRTLHFADRARSVMQTIRLNETTSGSTELLLARVQVAKLRERLASEQRRRHETRAKEHQALQRDFLDKLKGKEREISKLAKDNAVFQRWRDEDVKKIRALESRVKDLEHQVNASFARASAQPRVSSITASAQQTMAVVSTDTRSGSTLRTEQSRSNLPCNTAEKPDTSATRTYKQVLERYTLGPKTDLYAMKQTVRSRPEFPEKQEAASTTGNQLEFATSQRGHAGSSGEDEQWQCWKAPAASQPIRIPPEETATALTRSLSAFPGLATTEMTVSDHQRREVAALNAGDTKAWSSGLRQAPAAVHTAARYTADWTSPMLANSPQATPTQSQIQAPAPATQLSASRREHPAMLKNLGGSYSYGALPQSSTTVASGSRANIQQTAEPCLKHMLAGCMLCCGGSQRYTCNGPERSASLGSPVSTTGSNGMAKTHDLQDSPCGRHHLLCCFICMRNSAVSSSAATATPTGRAPPSAYTSNAWQPKQVSTTRTYPSAASTSTSLHASFSGAKQPEPQDKCALHALTNCILCAGVKAMTRKMGAPAQPSPAKLSSSLGASTAAADERVMDRYRLLSYQS